MSRGASRIGSPGSSSRPMILSWASFCPRWITRVGNIRRSCTLRSSGSTSSPLASDPFNNLPEGATLLTANNTLLQISYSAGDGNDISLTTLPEPTTTLAFAACAFALSARRQRKLPG